MGGPEPSLHRESTDSLILHFLPALHGCVLRHMSVCYNANCEKEFEVRKRVEEGKRGKEGGREKMNKEVVN